MIKVMLLLLTFKWLNPMEVSRHTLQTAYPRYTAKDVCLTLFNVFQSSLIKQRSSSGESSKIGSWLDFLDKTRELKTEKVKRSPQRKLMKVDKLDLPTISWKTECQLENESFLWDIMKVQARTCETLVLRRQSIPKPQFAESLQCKLKSVELQIRTP